MVEKRKSDRTIDSRAAARIAEGSKRGAESVSREFAKVITRNRFCEQVGIHATTLKRWERTGVVNPDRREVIGIPTVVFSEADVVRARKIAALLNANTGTMSAKQAAATVDGE